MFAMAGRRTRQWMFLVYPENHNIDICSQGDSDIKSLLEPCKVPCYYILHDKDGKKPHYHVIAVYGSVKGEKQVKTDFENVCANGKVEACSDYGACMRYLIHYDNENKLKYEPERVQTVGPLPAYTDVIKDLVDCKKAVDFGDVADYAIGYGIKDFAVLLYRCRFYRPDLYRAILKFNTADNDRLRMLFRSDYEAVEEVILHAEAEYSELR